MYITLRNGKKYRRPDGRPICWEDKGDRVKEVVKEESTTPLEEDDALNQLSN